MLRNWGTQQEHMQAQWNEINAENRDLLHRSDETEAERQQAAEAAAQLAATRTELQEETAAWAWQAQATLAWQENEASMRVQQAEARNARPGSERPMERSCRRAAFEESRS